MQAICFDIDSLRWPRVILVDPPGANACVAGVAGMVVGYPQEDGVYIRIEPIPLAYGEGV